MRWIMLIATCIWFVQCGDTEIEPGLADIVNYVNSINSTWKAHSNFDPNYYQAEDFQVFCGSKSGKSILPYNYPKLTLHDVPETFDARKMWSNCRSIHQIRDQGSCGSCWAFGAVEAMSDRYCIASKGLIDVTLSAEDLLSCCQECGDGCQGGDSQYAWLYWVNHGLVSGGRYHDNTTCQPYKNRACEHHSEGKRPKCGKKAQPTPKCAKQCKGNISINYTKDKHYGISAYRISSEVRLIQMEILQHGPVEASFLVYSDFLNYESGVYHHITGKLLAGHAVKILGWGTENGAPYWLAANSWNTDWGEKGFFKIRRGNNECGIENLIVAGIPEVNLI